MRLQSTNLMALLTMAPSASPAANAAAAEDQVRRGATGGSEPPFGKLSSQELEALAGWFNRNFFRLEDAHFM